MTMSIRSLCVQTRCSRRRHKSPRFTETITVPRNSMCLLVWSPCCMRFWHSRSMLSPTRSIAPTSSSQNSYKTFLIDYPHPHVSASYGYSALRQVSFSLLSSVGPLQDLIISALLMLLWLVSSAIWAVSVNDMSFYSEPNRVFARLEVECASDEKPVVTTRASRAIARTPQNGDCTLPDKANLMMLDISLVFGFSNVLLWGAGLWFNLKECPQVLSSFASLAQVPHPTPPHTDATNICTRIHPRALFMATCIWCIGRV